MYTWCCKVIFCLFFPLLYGLLNSWLPTLETQAYSGGRRDLSKQDDNPVEGPGGNVSPRWNFSQPTTLQKAERVSFVW
jgi:hypothetical protein